MIKKFGEHQPQIDPAAYVFENAAVIGQVRLAARVSVWPGCVLRGDVAGVFVGEDTNLQDGALVHTNYGMPAIIGKGTTVGHGAIIHGCTIGDNCLIAMGAIILNGAIIENDCIIGAGAVVTENTRIAKGHLVLGVPGKIVRPLTPEEMDKNRKSAEEYLKLTRAHRG